MSRCRRRRGKEREETIIKAAVETTEDGMRRREAEDGTLARGAQRILLSVLQGRTVVASVALAPVRCDGSG